MSKNKQLLKDFTKYCREHPDERFWQALRNWSGLSLILAAKDIPDLDKWDGKGGKLEDTFYWDKEPLKVKDITINDYPNGTGELSKTNV